MKKGAIFFIIAFAMLITSVVAIPFQFHSQSNYRQINLKLNTIKPFMMSLPNLELNVISSNGICRGNQGAVQIQYQVSGNFRNAQARFTCVDPTGQIARPMQSVENRNVLDGVAYTQSLIFANLVQPNGQLIQPFSGQLVCSVRACDGVFCSTVNDLHVNVPQCIN